MKRALYVIGVLIAFLLLYTDYEGHTFTTLMGLGAVEAGVRGAGGQHFFNHK